MASPNSPGAETALPPLLITRTDLTRLQDTVERGLNSTLHHTAELLELELHRARVVPPEEMPPDVVTMRSRVRFEDTTTGRQREVTLVYPPDADMNEGRLSVLMPVGAALLGMRAGDCIDWPLPDGRTTRLKVISVTWQPEAAGDFSP